MGWWGWWGCIPLPKHTPDRPHPPSYPPLHSAPTPPHSLTLTHRGDCHAEESGLVSTGASIHEARLRAKEAALLGQDSS